ncbi:hypothetical protein BB561_003678 [Smittium simulii]|uniref:Uncharacterized protein n=1 Tax=Smittium simulii TaxID=133385 RepID=A0A2T9YK34_9FUNG|nr:hypothetical protein BB561_003678 [Smittium simulii]
MTNSTKDKKTDSSKSKPQIAKNSQNENSDNMTRQTLVDKVLKQEEKQNKPKIASELMENINLNVCRENSLQKTDQNTIENIENASENTVFLDGKAVINIEPKNSDLLKTKNKIIVSTESDSVHNKDKTATKIDSFNKVQDQQATIINKTNSRNKVQAQVSEITNGVKVSDNDSYHIKPSCCSKKCENLKHALKQNNELEEHNKKSKDSLKQHLLELQNNSKTGTQELDCTYSILDELNKKLSEMNSLNETLKSESNKKIKKLTKSLEQANAEIEKHIDKQSEFDITVASAQDEMEMLKFVSYLILEKKCEVEKNNVKLKQQISFLQAKLSDMNSEFGLKNNTLEQNKIIITEYSEKFQSANNNLDKIYVLNNELQKDKVDLTKEIQSLKHELSVQSSKVNGLVNGNKELIQSQEYFQRTTAQLQDNLLESENKKKKYEGEINQKNTEIESAQKQLETFENDLKMKNVEISELTNNLDKTQQNMTETITKLSEELKEIKIEKDTLQANNLELEKVNKTNATKLDFSSKMIKDIEVQLSSANKKIHGKNAENIKPAEQLRLSIVSNKEKNTVTSDLNIKEAKLQSMFEEKKQSHDKLKVELNLAKEALKQASIKYNGLDKIHNSLKTNFETAKKNNVQLRTQIKGQVCSNTKLNYQIRKLNEAKCKAHKELEEFTKSLSESKNTVTQLSTQLEDIKKEHLQKINSHKNEIESNKKEIQKLQSIIIAKESNLTSTNLQSESAIRSNNNKIAELKKKISDMENIIKELKAKIKKNEQDMLRKDSQLKSAKEILNNS